MKNIIKRNLLDVSTHPTGLKHINRNRQALTTDFLMGVKLGLSEPALTNRARILVHADAFHPDFGNALRHLELDLAPYHDLREGVDLDWHIPSHIGFDGILHFEPLEQLWDHSEVTALCWSFAEFLEACQAPHEEEME